mmetsp:Transcript_26330/g.61777  ORF Transcript_26330/g.61777 Transcript_26330/m.61777 type:complete len:209 (+) Transcript_26330:1921-2547(+)
MRGCFCNARHAPWQPNAKGAGEFSSATERRRRPPYWVRRRGASSHGKRRNDAWVRFWSCSAWLGGSLRAGLSRDAAPASTWCTPRSTERSRRLIERKSSTCSGGWKWFANLLKSFWRLARTTTARLAARHRPSSTDSAWRWKPQSDSGCASRPRPQQRRWSWKRLRVRSRSGCASKPRWRPRPRPQPKSRPSGCASRQRRKCVEMRRP